MTKKLFVYLFAFIISFAIAFGYYLFILGSKFSSTAVVYPTSTLNPQFLLEAGLRFGDEKELNELIEVLHSNDVALKVLSSIHKEKMESLNQEDISKLLKELKSNTAIERGINRSVSITVTHEDPILAANIANSYSTAGYDHLSDLVINSVEEHLNVMTELYDKKLEEVALLQDTLEKLETIGESKVEGMVLVKTPRYRFFDTKFEFEMKKLGEIKNHKEHLEGVIKKNVPQLFVVSQARPQTEISKSSSIFKSFLFSILSVLLLAVVRNRKRFFTTTH